MKLDRFIAEALQKLREGPDSAYERLKTVVLGGTSVRSIREVSPDKFPGRSLGRYFPSKRVIAMSGMATDPWRLYVLAHEAGHAMTRDERGAWEVAERLLRQAGIKPDQSFYQRKEKSLRPATEGAHRRDTTDTYGKPGQFGLSPKTGAVLGHGNIGGMRNRGTPGYPVPPETKLGTQGAGHLETQDEAAEKEHEGTFIGFKVPVAEVLAIEGGEPAGDLHITLFYQKGLSRKQAGKVEAAFYDTLEELGPPRVSILKTDVFPASESSDGKRVLYAKVEGSDLQKFRARLVALLAEDGIDTSSKFPGYKPHITLKYLDDGEEVPDIRLPKQKFDLDTSVFKPGTPNKGLDEAVKRERGAAGPIKLARSIPHLDDLKPEQFMEFLRKFADEPLRLEASEKVDGSARITFGRQGEHIWTQSKNGGRRASPEAYLDTPMFRSLKMAHTALEGAAPAITAAWPQDTDHFVAEVLHSRVPNVIEYGPNALVIHGAFTDDGRQLGGAQARAAAGTVIDAAGGKLSDGREEWRFDYKRVVPSRDVQVDVREELSALGKLYRKLQAEPRDQDIQDQFQSIQRQVKEKLLARLREQKPAYGPEGGDIEGLVFRDLESGQMTKLVDKDLFTRLNKFLWHYREMLEKGAKVGDQWQKGVMQGFREVVAKQVLGAPVASTPGFVKFLVRNYGERAAGKGPEQKADQVLARYIQEQDLMTGDFALDFQRSLMGAFKDFARLRAEWEQFKSQPQSIDLGGGRVREFPSEHIGRTDEAFQGALASLEGIKAGLETAGSIQHPLTQKVALLKLFMGHRFEKLAEELGEGEQEGEGEPVQEGVFSPDISPQVLGIPHDNWSSKRQFPAGGPALYADKFASKLAKHGIRLGAYLGEGAFGGAWDIGGGKVLKVTSDQAEAKASNFLKGKDLKHVAHIFDVFKFPPVPLPPNQDPDELDTQGNRPYLELYYGIVLERLKVREDRSFDEALFELLEEAGEQLKTEGQLLLQTKLPWDDIVRASIEHARAGTGEGFENRLAAIKKQVAQVNERQIGPIRDELLRNSVKFRDIHSGNLGQRADGTWCVFDLGSDSVSPGTEPGVLERKRLRVKEGGPIDRETGPTDLGGKKLGPDRPECLEGAIRVGVARLIAEAAQRGTIGTTIGRYQPFHAGHAAILRKLCGQFASVVVFVAGQRTDQKNPFDHELRLKMMELSLPDVWSKLKVFPASIQGKGTGYIPGLVANAAASKQAAIGPEGAVVVLVGEDRLADVQKQVANNQKHAGEPGYYSGAITAQALPGVASDDDAGRISGTRVREALAADDKETVQALLDPRLVASAEFEEIYMKLRDKMRAAGLVQEIAETVINELGGGAAETGPGATRGGAHGTSGWSRAILAKDMTGDELYNGMLRSPSTRMLPLNHSGTPNDHVLGMEFDDLNDDTIGSPEKPTDLKDCIARLVRKLLA